MNKQDFLMSLRRRLAGLPQEELDGRLEFYEEMIDDRVEEGVSEADAVAAIGTVESVAAQILSEVPLTRLVKHKLRPKHRLRTWECLLLAIGSPLWLSLGIAAVAVFLSVYAVLWSVLVSLWAVWVAFPVCAIGGVVGGGILASLGNGAAGIFLVACSIVCSGMTIVWFFGCKAATRGIIAVTRCFALAVKRCFVRKEKTEI